MNVNQSTIIFGYLAAAFVIFITMRGELPIYMGFLLSKPRAAPDTAQPSATGSGKLTSTDIELKPADVLKVAAFL